MKSARRILALLIVAVMLVASLGACTKTGGDKEGEGTAGDVSSNQPVEQPADDANAYKPFVEVQGVTDTEILVGNTAATTGAFATVGVPFNAGLEAALKEYGEFQGRTIRLVHYDDGFDGAQGLVYTKQLVEDDKVFALVGHFGTNTVGATLDYLVDKGVPMVYAATGIQELYQENAKGNDGVIYSVQPIYTTEGRVLLARAVAPKETGMGLGGKNIGVIATTDDSGAGLIAGVKNQAEKLGLDLKYQEVEPAATDYSAAVSVLKNAGCDVVIACMNQAPLATFMASMRDANYNASIITSYVNASPTTLGKFVEDGSVTADRMVYTTAWLDTSSEAGLAGYMEFAAAMAAWELDNGLSGSEYALNSFAMAGYIAGNIFAQSLDALDKAGLELNYQNYYDIMEKTEFQIPMGGTLSYANGARLGVTSLALLSISTEPGASGYYELKVESPIMTLDEVLKAAE